MTTKIPFQIEIPRRNHACSKGDEVLAAGADYYSVIADEEDGRLSRQDFCAVCWEQVKEAAIANKQTYWKSRVIAKKAGSDPLQGRDERALELLKDAMTWHTADDYAEAFVLALYLARRRLILFRQALKQEDGSLVSVYEVAATEEMLGIRQVALSQLSVEKIQQQLAGKLNAGTLS